MTSESTEVTICQNAIDVVSDCGADFGLHFDKDAGIYFRSSMETTADHVLCLSALFVDKTNPCYTFLIGQGCDVTTADANRSFSATADGSRWYWTAFLRGLKVCWLLDSGAEYLYCLVIYTNVLVVELTSP